MVQQRGGRGLVTTENDEHIRIPNQLLEAVSGRRAVLFAGAGISVGALGLLGRNIRDAIGQSLQKDFPSYDYSERSVEDVCDEYVAIKSKVSLVERLAELFPQHATPAPGHVAAVELFRFICTTNWDTLFEAAYRQVAQPYQLLVRDDDAPSFNYDQHNLLKIHGSVDQPLTLIATTDDYESYPDTHARLLSRVGDLVHSNTVLFVGYGLRDEHLRRLLSRIRRERGPWSQKSFVVGYYDEVRTRLLESRGMQVIEADAGEFLPLLAKRAAAG
jgi:hypothetical protein